MIKPKINIKIKIKLSQILALVLSFSLILSGSLINIPTAQAMIRQQEETSTQTLYQSRHTLRDNQGETWQVILFKRIKDNQVKEANLRLVGFPEQTEFLHPQPLEITTNKGETFTAKDLFAEKTPSPNVGQYDFQPILLKLSQAQKLQLNLPLKNHSSTSLTIPLPVVLEWQEIMNS